MTVDFLMFSLKFGYAIARNGLLFVIVTTENSLGAYLRLRVGGRGQKEEYYYSVPSACIVDDTVGNPHTNLTKPPKIIFKALQQPDSNSNPFRKKSKIVRPISDRNTDIVALRGSETISGKQARHATLSFQESASVHTFFRYPSLSSAAI